MPAVELDEGEHERRFRSQFVDPAFDPLQAELDRVAGAARQGYASSRKSPRTAKAGADFADPDHDPARDWIAAHDAIGRAQAEYEDPAQPPCILVINGSSRSEHICPGGSTQRWPLDVRQPCFLSAKSCDRLRL